MKSIDRLREWWLHKFPVMDKGLGEEFRWHLDEIDREMADMVPLPLDADGVPIHVGDVMETDNGIREVDALQKSSRKWSIGLVPVGGGAFSWHNAETLRHHHAPTVEDVLREFLDNFHDASCIEVEADVVAEYAAKLRLAGEE